MMFRAAALLAAIVSAGAAQAQDAMEKPAGMPQDVADMLREIGPVIEGQRTGAAYTAMHPSEPYEGVIVYRDLSYGPHEHHGLDIIAADDGEEGKPVLVFVYGGGFAGGSKRGEGSPFYDNISRWAAENGMVGVQINYRLAPEFQFPSGVEDLDLLAEWLQHNIRIYGGDPDRVVFWGHSSGGSHVADYVAAHADEDDPWLAGAILMSSYYQLDPTEPSVWASYYGDDPSKYPEMASLPGLVKTQTPLMVVDSELDTEDANVQADLLTEKLGAARKPFVRTHLPNHSHLSEAYAIGTDDTSLSGPITGFVAVATARR